MYELEFTDRDVKAAIAYDMQQEFRYRRAWFLNPEGGNTVDFGRPLPCDDAPDALAIADELTDILTSINTEYPVRNEQYYDMAQRLSGIRTNK